MVTTLNDAKRMAIAEKLADMRATQNLLLSNEQRFLSECRDEDLRKRLTDMYEDDEKNLGIIETAITQYGIQAKPHEEVQKMVEQAQKLMESSELSFYEKMAQHELLKHGQVMSGLVVHKAAQVVGADIEEAIAPLNTVNFENRAHQEQLKGMLEVLGTRELTGQDPEQGVWARVQDALAALTGVVGSATTQASDRSDMDITQIILMDHQKTKTLMREIKNSSDPGRQQEFFGQLYKDLIVHSKAEEQTVYPQLRSFYDKTQDLYDEQAELEQVLNQVKAQSPGSSEFMQNLDKVKDLVNHHTRQEENEVFPAIRRNFSKDQREQMATQFKEAKKQLQQSQM